MVVEILSVATMQDLLYVLRWFYKMSTEGVWFY